MIKWTDNILDQETRTQQFIQGSSAVMNNFNKYKAGIRHIKASQL